MHGQASSLGRALNIGLRLGLLALSAGAVVLAFLIGRPHDRAVPSWVERYACPMHAQVESDAPANCPICGMALKRVTDSVASGGRELTPQDMGLVIRRLVGDEGGDSFSPAWIESDGTALAVLGDQLLSTLAPDARGTFTPTATSTVAFAVRLASGKPTPWDRGTHRVRFRVDHADARAPLPSPGDVGYVRLARKVSEMLVVPSSAVMDSPEGPYVLAASVDRPGFSMRPVTVGSTRSGLTPVLSGVRDQEVIVGRNPFFPDAERRAHALPEGMREAAP